MSMLTVLNSGTDPNGIMSEVDVPIILPSQMVNTWAEVSLLVEIHIVSLQRRTISRVCTAVIILSFFPPEYISHGLKDTYMKAKFYQLTL